VQVAAPTPTSRVSGSTATIDQVTSETVPRSGERQNPVRRLDLAEGPGCSSSAATRLDALAAAEVAKSGDGEPEVWARLFGREMLDLQRLAEGLIPLG
jgi:hypothetical protein